MAISTTSCVIKVVRTSVVLPVPICTQVFTPPERHCVKNLFRHPIEFFFSLKFFSCLNVLLILFQIATGHPGISYDGDVIRVHAATDDSEDVPMLQSGHLGAFVEENTFLGGRYLF